jgi:predicted ATPase
VPDRPEVPTSQSLSAHLQNKCILLVLDNCEHLASAIASLVASLLGDCPELRIIATSREALDVQGEALWWTPSLDPPESVQLFVERSRLKVPTYSLTEDNADAIGTICRRLDGIPLALELAAGLTGTMTSDDIAAGLDDRLGLLVSNVREGPPRHETLEKALDWSYNLLTPEEMVVFRRLAVFAGGFSLEAAQQVCADRSLAPELVRAILSQLVHKSMVVTDAPSEGRAATVCSKRCASTPSGSCAMPVRSWPLANDISTTPSPS